MTARAPQDRRDSVAGKRLDQSPEGDDLTAHQTAAYIADMTLELRNQAHRAGLHFLTYLLEMAFEEAFERSRKNGK